MRAASENSVSVLLDGQGGDELLAGYLRYRRNRAVSLVKRGRPSGFLLALKNPKAFGYLAFHYLPSSLCASILRYLGQSYAFLEKSFVSPTVKKRT